MTVKESSLKMKRGLNRLAGASSVCGVVTVIRASGATSKDPALGWSFVSLAATNDCRDALCSVS